VYRPAQEIIARALSMCSLAKPLRYNVFAGLYRAMDSDGLSDALRASTLKHLGYEMGLMYWREIQSHFSRRFTDHPDAEEGEDAEEEQEPAHYAQRGHSMTTGYKHYGRADDSPIGVPWTIMLSQLRASRFWQDLTGTSLLPDVCFNTDPTVSVQA